MEGKSEVSSNHHCSPNVTKSQHQQLYLLVDLKKKKKGIHIHIDAYLSKEMIQSM